MCVCVEGGVEVKQINTLNLNVISKALAIVVLETI